MSIYINYQSGEIPGLSKWKTKLKCRGIAHRVIRSVNNLVYFIAINTIASMLWCFLCLLHKQLYVCMNDGRLQMHEVNGTVPEAHLTERRKMGVASQNYGIFALLVFTLSMASVALVEKWYRDQGKSNFRFNLTPLHSPSVRFVMKMNHFGASCAQRRRHGHSMLRVLLSRDNFTCGIPMKLEELVKVIYLTKPL